MQTKKILARLAAAGLVCSPVSAEQQRYDRPYDQPYDNSGYGVVSLEERVARLEKKQGGNALTDMSDRVGKLQVEVLKLRGQVEDLAIELEKTRRQQREMYSDLDQRLQKPLTPTPATASAASPTAEAGTPPTTNASGTPPAADAGAIPPPPAPPAPPPVDPAARQAAYQQAFNTLKEGKYNEAIKGFNDFLVAYPGGELADNAIYWLAEAYYVNRDFSAARDNFQKMVKDFPQSPKVPDANLKLGFIEYENGQYAAAKDLLTDLIQRYPGTSAAKLAEKRLERMRQEKH